MTDKLLEISASLSLPLDFVTGTQAIVATKGKGKTHLAQVEAEELLDLNQVIVAIDPTDAWWGLRSSPDGRATGYPIPVIGGDHGDLALSPNAGEVLADAIVEKRFSCVICTEGLSKGAEIRFVGELLERLYRKNREPLHVFVDEADMFAPQKPFGVEDAKTLGAMQNVVRRGRKKGLGCTMITQRPSVINKDVLSQVDMLMVLGMSHNLDIDPIEKWMRRRKKDDASALIEDMLASLPDLPQGDAWAWSPSTHLHQRFRARAKRTFDSGATPKPGQPARTAKVLAPVDIKRLGAAISATAESAKSDDPKVLRARISELEKQLAGKPGARTVEKIVERVVERQILEPRLVEQLKSTLRGIEHRVVPLEAELRELRTELGKVWLALHATEVAGDASRVASAAPARPPIAKAPKDPKAAEAAVRELERARPTFLPAIETDAPSATTAADRQEVLDAIFAVKASGLPVTIQTVAAWLGFHPKTKSLLKAIGVLRMSGDLEGLELTQSGLLNVSNDEQPPVGVREKLRACIGGQKLAIIDTIAAFEKYGRPITHVALAVWLQVHPKTKSYLEDLGGLRDRGYLIGLQLTELGKRAAAPRHAPSVADMLLVLEESQRKIVDTVIRRGKFGTIGELAEQLGVHPKTKSLLSDLGTLRSRGMLTDGWPLEATDVFLRGAA